MKFRPCIDLHEGKVKQIVGSSFRDSGEGVVVNYQSSHSPAYYAAKYRQDNLWGGHVIALGAGNEAAVLQALEAYPGGLQVGGGVTDSNAFGYLEHGASHVIVTSFVFSQGYIHWERLAALEAAVGRQRLVLDLSCKLIDGKYMIMTDRWQKAAAEHINGPLLDRLALHCSEFLVHAAHVEGKMAGVDEELIELLGHTSLLPVTYAGGIRSIADLEVVREAGRGLVDATIGSALDIFGGALAYQDVVAWHNAHQLQSPHL
jgi:phosphoribosylformimino-5-aminoimidazole carboxamide ribotide isomerase